MEGWKQVYREIHTKAYEVSIIKPVPSEWVEENIFLPEGVSKIRGKFSYDYSPYCREVINTLAGDHPARSIAIMKAAQIGFTQGLIVPGMAYVIAKDAYPMLFMAGDKELAKKSIEERFDPILQSSGLHHLIKPSVIRAKNQRTGDTSLSKEYAGGRLTIEGTNNANKMRQISVKIIWADDFEAAPRADKKEGSIRKLFEGRQTSYGNMAKTYFISTPATKQTSNIEPVYLLGDQRKWFWKCPLCEERFTPEWSTKLPDGSYAGIVWKLDNKGQLINGSVKYKCPHCLGLIDHKEKYDLNLGGIWIPTAEPKIENYVSYYINALCCPPGFISWTDLVKEWLEACPPNQTVKKDLLKTFVNIRLGQTWEEKGENLKVNALMKNTREYSVGVVPDETSEADGNGKIVLLTLSADLGGVHNEQLKDGRLDWEVKAHAANGQTYSVEHGSIGTFRRVRSMTKKQQEDDIYREKWNYDLNQPLSVWEKFEELMRRGWICESGERMVIGLTVIDTGHFGNLVKKFISSVTHELNVVGVIGRVEANFRKISKDTPFVVKSKEQNNLYIIEVNLVKDLVADNIKLTQGIDGYQPEGFMNFPMPSDGLYTMKSYFSHFESERRVEEIVNDEVVGFKWEKVSQENHFWDVNVYNVAAREIFLDLLRKSDPRKFKDLNWASFVTMLGY